MFKGPGSGGHLGLELKYKATLKPEDAERSKGARQQEQHGTDAHLACCKVQAVDQQQGNKAK